MPCCQYPPRHYTIRPQPSFGQRSRFWNRPSFREAPGTPRHSPHRLLPIRQGEAPQNRVFPSPRQRPAPADSHASARDLQGIRRACPHREDPAQGIIRVRAKTVDGESWQPKTKVNRLVPISRALRAHLDRYFPRPTPVRWYFPSPDGKHCDADNFSADLRAANTHAGLKWGCLDYRHTFGSQLVIQGESLYKIATLLGNSPDFCRRHYAVLVPERLEDSVDFAVPVSQRHSDTIRFAN